MLAKDRLIFDTTDLPSSDQVGSYIIGKGGLVVTSSTTGGYEALDVYIRGGTFNSAVADDDIDTENPLKVGSHSRFGLLPAISATNDKADLISDKYRRVYVSHSSSVGHSAAAVTVGTSAVQLDTSLQAGRNRIMVQNLGSKDIYVGPTGVLTTSGLRVASGSTLEVDGFSENLSIFAISGTAGQNVRVWQLG